MSDVRALLKAKRQEARITHPLATYTPAGTLRCAACGTAVKHASAWEGHVGSKAHRTHAARLRERARAEAEAEERERESRKRKAMEVDGEDDEGEGEDGDGEGDGDVPMGDAKRRRTESEEPVPPGSKPSASASTHDSRGGALPADFFSDPSLAPPPVADDDDDDDEGTTPATTAAGAAAGGADTIELEWQQFQQAVLAAPDYQETYARATVAAAPVLAAEVPQGFPTGDDGDGDAAGEKEGEMDEEGRRRRRAQDERELIMDRLLEEEQAQEEADARVSVLKTKLDALRRRREAARAAKTGAGPA